MYLSSQAARGPDVLDSIVRKSTKRGHSPQTPRCGSEPLCLRQASQPPCRLSASCSQRGDEEGGRFWPFAASDALKFRRAAGTRSRHRSGGGCRQLSHTQAAVGRCCSRPSLPRRSRYPDLRQRPRHLLLALCDYLLRPQSGPLGARRALIMLGLHPRRPYIGPAWRISRHLSGSATTTTATRRRASS
jgi:hypothetical protein